MEFNIVEFQIIYLGRQQMVIPEIVIRPNRHSCLEPPDQKICVCCD